RVALARLAEPRAGLEGLLFDYVHFYGSFHTAGASRRWYRREVRAVRRGVGVRSWKDAQGFRVGDPPRKLRAAASGARVFHYGGVRPPETQKAKLADFERLYRGEAARAQRLEGGFTYDVAEKVRRFEGTHPAPMRDFVARCDWPFEPRPRRLRLG